MTSDIKLVPSRRWTCQVFDVISELQKTSVLCDIEMVSSEGIPIKAHSVILASSSSYIHDRLIRAPQGYYNMKTEVPHGILSKMVDYMYSSVIHISHNEWHNLLDAALFFKIESLRDQLMDYMSIKQAPAENDNEDCCDMDLEYLVATQTWGNAKDTEKTHKRDLACGKQSNCDFTRKDSTSSQLRKNLSHVVVCNDKSQQTESVTTMDQASQIKCVVYDKSQQKNSDPKPISTEASVQTLKRSPSKRPRKCDPKPKDSEKQAISGELLTISDKIQTVPDEKQTRPDEKLTIPGGKPTVPGEKQTLLGEKQMAGGEKQTVSEEKRTVGKEKQAVTCEKRTVHGQKQTVTGEKQTVPREKQTVPREKQTVHRVKQKVTAEKQTDLREKQKVTAEKQTVPREKQTTTGEKRSISGEKRTVSGEKRTVHREKQTGTAEKRTVLGEKQTVTAEKQNVPKEKHKVTSQKQKITCEKRTVPEEKQTETCDKQTNLGVKQTDTSKKDATTKNGEKSCDGVGSNATNANPKLMPSGEYPAHGEATHNSCEKNNFAHNSPKGLHSSITADSPRQSPNPYSCSNIFSNFARDFSSTFENHSVISKDDTSKIKMKNGTSVCSSKIIGSIFLKDLQDAEKKAVPNNGRSLDSSSKKPRSKHHKEISSHENLKTAASPLSKVKEISDTLADSSLEKDDGPPNLTPITENPPFEFDLKEATAQVPDSERKKISNDPETSKDVEIIDSFPPDITSWSQDNAYNERKTGRYSNKYDPLSSDTDDDYIDTISQRKRIHKLSLKKSNTPKSKEKSSSKSVDSDGGSTKKRSSIPCVKLKKLSPKSLSLNGISNSDDSTKKRKRTDLNGFSVKKAKTGSSSSDLNEVRKLLQSERRLVDGKSKSESLGNNPKRDFENPEPGEPQSSFEHKVKVFRRIEDENRRKKPRTDFGKQRCDRERSRNSMSSENNSTSDCEEETSGVKFVGRRVWHEWIEADQTRKWYQGIVLGLESGQDGCSGSVYVVQYNEDKYTVNHLLEDYKDGSLTFI